MQVCKTRNCIQTCDGWPNGCASQFAGSSKSQKSSHNRWLVINLYWLVLDGQMVKNLCWLVYALSLINVNTSDCKWLQGGGQTKHKLNRSRKLISPFEFVWPGLYSVSISITELTKTATEHFAHLSSEGPLDRDLFLSPLWPVSMVGIAGPKGAVSEHKMTHLDTHFRVNFTHTPVVVVFLARPTEAFVSTIYLSIYL